MKLLRNIIEFFRERDRVIRQIEASKAFSLSLQDRLEEKLWQRTAI